MSAAKHTPGPWSQGRTLRTSQTQQWTPEQWSRNQAMERRMVFSRFTSADGGRSRILVAQCDLEEDARVIAALPDLLSFAKLVLRGLESGAIRAKPIIDVDPDAEQVDMRPLATIARAAIAKAEAQ